MTKSPSRWLRPAALPGEGLGAGAVTSASPDKPHPNPSPGSAAGRSQREGLRSRDKAATPKDVVLAAIAGAHGVTGEVRLKLFGEGVAALKLHKSFNGGALTLKSLRDDGKGGAVARFAEVAERNAAEALRGTTLTVPRSALPPLEEGEYYHADLLALAAVSDAGEPLGIVIAVENFGAGDILEIERPDGKRFMVPMSEAAVPEWNDRQVVIAADFAQA